MNKDVVFTDKDLLVNYVYNKLDNPTLIKVQKTLYLLFAFYGATYGMIDNEIDDEFEGQTYAKRLFDADFEAWRYGPVEIEVYKKQKSGDYELADDVKIPRSAAEWNNIMSFIDDIINQTNKINDFGLVDRTHQDNAWANKFQEGISHIKMDNSEIIKEYLERYVKAPANV